MVFTDQTPQTEVSQSLNQTPEADVAYYTDADLSNFLKRPIRISQIDWAYATNVNGVLNPWSLFMGDTRVKNRIAYYSLIKFDLCVKFVVNGNQFQYGKIMFDYCPFDTTYVVNGVTYAESLKFTDTTSTVYPVCASQRMNLSLSPTTSTGGCMRLPFFWPNDWLSIPLEEWKYLGNLRYYTINQLKHANDDAYAGLDPPKISIFAWAENVKMCIPTGTPPATLVAQADEYVGSISGPASNVARAAGMLENIPYIGTYARATSAAAGLISRVARVFGYSRPPIITNFIRNVPCYVGQMAPTDAAEVVNKLTLDSRNEIALNPACVGGPGEDELALSSFNRRWSYLTSFNWAYSQAPDTMLFSTAVTPKMYARNTSYAVTRCVMPASCCIAAIPFEYWQGGMEYKFEVVCSGFHRGRLRIIYDPYGTPTVANFNQNYQDVLDIETGADTIMTVNWAQRTPAQKVGAIDLTSNLYSTTIPTVVDEDQYNGCLYVYVLNNLSVPNMVMSAAQSSVYVNVYVRTAEDMQYFVPTNSNLSLLSVTAPFEPASSEMEVQADEGVPGDETIAVSVGVSKPDDNLALILFGESVVSFRNMLRRYTDYINWAWTNAANTNPQDYKLSMRRFPLYPGNDTAGLYTITNLLGVAAPYSGNMYTLNPLMLIAPLFAGYRGSLRYKYVFENYVNATPLTFSARVTRHMGTACAYSTTDLGATMSSLKLATSVRNGQGAWQGCFVTHNGFNPTLEFEDPYLEREKFHNPKTFINNTITNTGGHVISINCKEMNAATDQNRFISRGYVSTGEDFNLFFYTGPVLLWTSGYY